MRVGKNTQIVHASGRQREAEIVWSRDQVTRSAYCIFNYTGLRPRPGIACCWSWQMHSTAMMVERACPKAVVRPSWRRGSPSTRPGPSMNVPRRPQLAALLTCPRICPPPRLAHRRIKGGHLRCSVTQSGNSAGRSAFSVAYFYELKQAGLAPRTMNLGSRRIISVEEAQKWCRERTEASESARC